jgi:hypothetical protein
MAKFERVLARFLEFKGSLSMEWFMSVKCVVIDYGHVE